MTKNFNSNAIMSHNKELKTNKIKNTKKFVEEIFGATKIIDFRGFLAFTFQGGYKEK